MGVRILSKPLYMNFRPFPVKLPVKKIDKKTQLLNRVYRGKLWFCLVNHEVRIETAGGFMGTGC